MKEEIIRMAEEAEINLLFKGHPEHPERDSNDVIIFTGWVNHRTLRRFAALVAAAERNAILQMSRDQWFKTQADFEDAIRARGQA